MYEVYIKRYPDNYRERIYGFCKKYSTLEEALARVRTYIKNRNLNESDFKESPRQNGIIAELDHGTIRPESHHIAVRSWEAHEMRHYHNRIFEHTTTPTE